MATQTKKSPLKAKARRTPKATMAEIRQWLTQFLVLKDETKELAVRQNDLKARLMAETERQGYADDQGHQYIDLDVPVDGVKSLKREKRVTSTLNEERTEALLRKRKPVVDGKKQALWDRCTTTVTVIDEEKILQALYEEDDEGNPLLTQDDIDSMFDQNITYAFIPKR